MISPASFIPAAERYNLMPDVDRWVIRNAFDQLGKLGHGRQRDADGAAVFINLSANSLSDPDLVAYIEEQQARNQLNPASIGFEITETAAIADFDCALEMITGLRRSGFRVALDDFGTGMSSFAYLKALDIDYLKIDGSFVRTMLDDRMNCAIVEAISSIARVAGIQTIAEFVETGPILDRLKDLGVAYAQGWAVHRPEPLIDD